MYQGSRIIIPMRHGLRLVPTQIQPKRNIWELMRTDMRKAFRDVERQMDHLERQFFPRSLLRIITPRFMPIEGKESSQDSVYSINLDVQGFKPEDIKVSLKEGVLKIEAQMDKTAEDGSRFQQSIVREFTLPPNVEQSSLKSLLHDDGVLSIEASLSKPNNPKDIPIQHLEDNMKSKM